MSRVRVPEGVPNGPLVKWLRRRPLTPQTGVRLSYGSPFFLDGDDSGQRKRLILAAKAVKINKVGADCGEGPPVPIPNTAVKLICAENTWLVTAREDR